MPDCWELLSTDQFIYLTGLLRAYAAGYLSVGAIRLAYVKKFLNISDKKVVPSKKDEVFANLYILQNNVKFIFNIQYKPEIWNNLSTEIRKVARKTEPVDLPDTPEARYLRKQDYKFVIDAVFAKQLIPVIKIGIRKYKGYAVNTSFGELSCSLTARQYIDASERLFRLSENPELLPLLVAILYCPGRYYSDWAHNNAYKFAKLSPDLLEAVALNFQAFVIFLFERTHYNILRQKEDKKPKGIFVGMSEGLYNLSTDGYGDLDTVGNFPVIEYLEILRKKLIESVRSMHASEMKLTDIQTKTGLELNLINKIIT